MATHVTATAQYVVDGRPRRLLARAIRVVAACFEGLAPEKRQALVNAVLGPDADGVEVVCETPGEAGS